MSEPVPVAGGGPGLDGPADPDGPEDPDLRAFVTALPKAELHLHLEGTLEPEAVFALAERNGIALSHASVEDVRATYRFDSLASFLAVYYPAMDVLRTAQDFTDLAWAYLQRAAAQGVVRAEVFFDPQAHTSRGVPFDVVVEGLGAAVRRAPGELGVQVALIMCFLRDRPVPEAMATLEASLRHRDAILGVGLDSDERGHPPVDFAAVFARARECGYRLTMHCDIDQVGSIDHIAQVLDVIGVDRIDHGTNVVEDPALVARVRELGLGLTTCPVSNSFVTADMKAAEITSLLRAGVRVTVNSDDPAYFGGYVVENYLALARAGGLGRAELVQLARNSLEASWAPPQELARHLAALEEFAAAHP